MAADQGAATAFKALVHLPAVDEQLDELTGGCIPSCPGCKQEAQVAALLDGIHAAVSLTYIDGEAARLKARIALKQAAGWPLSDGEEARLAELESDRG